MKKIARSLLWDLKLIRNNRYIKSMLDDPKKSATLKGFCRCSLILSATRLKVSNCHAYI
jgi:hypothetical protein